MFRQVKVDVFGVVENMGIFHCPHCQHEIDIFSQGGAERMARQFSVPFLGSVELNPEIRRGGDSGKPPALAGVNSELAKTFYEVAKKLAEESAKHNTESVIQIT